jgi:hypothetical protein
MAPRTAFSPAGLTTATPSSAAVRCLSSRAGSPLQQRSAPAVPWPSPAAERTAAPPLSAEPPAPPSLPSRSSAPPAPISPPSYHPAACRKCSVTRAAPGFPAPSRSSIPSSAGRRSSKQAAPQAARSSSAPARSNCWAPPSPAVSPSAPPELSRLRPGTSSAAMSSRPESRSTWQAAERQAVRSSPVARARSARETSARAAPISLRGFRPAGNRP